MKKTFKAFVIVLWAIFTAISGGAFITGDLITGVAGAILGAAMIAILATLCEKES